MVRRLGNLAIGGDMSGLPLALRTARHGTTAFVERDLLGGTCLNRGRIPTKTMIASAKLARQVCRAARTIHVHPTLTEDVNTTAGKRPSSFAPHASRT